MSASSRRAFLGGLAGGTVATGLAPGAAGGTPLSLTDRVARAMLSMQRAAWEQGVDGEGYVRGGCGSPTFDRPGTATEGQAFCLLMEAARAG